MAEDLRHIVAIALHDAECSDHHCTPTVMGTFFAEADALLAAHDAQVRATADTVIRAVLDALGVGYDRDPVLAAKEAKGVADKFGEWLDNHDAQVKAEAWDEGAEMGHRLYAESIYTIRARNPYRAAETEATR